ncbi:MAG: sulfotransferase [Thermodesulfobacteriota bacterium]
MRPIFITGSERSGTTLLAVLLGRHSRVAVTPETHFCYRLAAGDWRRPSDHDTLLHAFDRLPHVADLGISGDELAGRFRRSPPTPAALFNALLEEYGDRRGCDIVAEKSPHHVFSGEMLLRHFPAGRLLHIFRDGRDTVQSIRNTGWSWVHPGRRVRAAVVWRQCVAAGTALAENHPGRVLAVRYENLLRFPERELRSICAFVGIDWEKGMLAPQAGSEAVPPWEEAVKGKACDSLDSSRVLAWRRTLVDRDHWLLNALMAPWLSRLSFPDCGRGDCPPLLWGYLQLLRPLAYLLYSRRAIRMYEAFRRPASG